MKKSTVSLLFSLLPFTALLAQQEPVFSMYAKNKMNINPAFAGFNGKHEILFSSRTFAQDIFTERATYYFAYDAYLDSINSGIGAAFLYDKYGASKTYQFSFNYQYSHWFDKDNSLRAGVLASFISPNYEGYWIDIIGAGSNLPVTTYRDNQLLAGGGVVFTSHASYLAFSVKNISLFHLDEDRIAVDISPFYYLGGGTRYKHRPWLMLEPSALMRYSGTEVSLDVNCNFYFANIFYVGGLYRFNPHVASLLAGISLRDRFELGFAYDMNIVRNNYRFLSMFETVMKVVIQ